VHFQRSYDYIRDLGFSDLHVFKYSPRKGTPAADFKDQVLSPDKETRSQRLMALAQEAKQSFAAQFRDCSLAVLLEEEVEVPDLMELDRFDWVKQTSKTIRCWAGYTDNYIRVAIPVAGSANYAEGPLGPGKLVKVILNHSGAEFSFGSLTGI